MSSLAVMDTRMNIRPVHSARRLLIWCRTREGAVFIALLAVALIVRLLLAPFQGFFGDLQGYVTWGQAQQTHFLDFYSYGLNQPWPPSYPPLSEYLFGFFYWLNGLFAHLFGYDPTSLVFRSWQLAIFMKTPELLSDLGTTIAVFVVARRHLTLRWAYIAAASFAFSPVVLYIGALWGQTDSVFTFFLVLALLFTAERKGLWAGIFFGLTLMLKPEPVIYGPIIVLYLWRWASPREAVRAVAAMGGVSLALCLPYLLPPKVQMVVYAKDLLPAVLARLPFASPDAYNFWWLLGVEHNNPSAPWLGPLTISEFGWLCYLATLALSAWCIWKDRSAGRLFQIAALIALSFFLFGAGEHERYLFPAIPLFLLAAVYDRRNVKYYVAISLTVFVNLAYTSIASGIFTNLPSPQPFSSLMLLRPFIADHAAYSTTVAAVNLWALGSLLLLLARDLRRAPPTMPAPPSSTERTRGNDLAQPSPSLVAAGLRRPDAGRDGS